MVQAMVEQHNLLPFRLLVQDCVNVPGMWVAVDPPGAEHHLSEEVRQHASHPVRVHPRLGQGSRAVRRDHSCDELHSEHPLGGVLPEHFWNLGVRLVGKVLACELRVPSLNGKVQLGADGNLEVVHDPCEVKAPRLDLLAEHPEHCKVGRHLLQQPWVLDLHRHLCPILEDRSVDLRQGGRRERALVHALKNFVEAVNAKVLLDDLSQVGEGPERGLVADNFQGVDVGLWNGGVPRPGLKRRHELGCLVVDTPIPLRELEALISRAKVELLQSLLPLVTLLALKALLVVALDLVKELLSEHSPPHAHREVRRSHLRPPLAHRLSWPARFGSLRLAPRQVGATASSPPPRAAADDFPGVGKIGGKADLAGGY
mmetsp:Transcript_5459/g.19063  ORF Transcript_5459/g.19063 Transcript_5459/m.19063 type:complete len:371 (+) Transcript_5459:1870-2982(+)